MGLTDVALLAGIILGSTMLVAVISIYIRHRELSMSSLPSCSFRCSFVRPFCMENR